MYIKLKLSHREPDYHTHKTEKSLRTTKQIHKKTNKCTLDKMSHKKTEKSQMKTKQSQRKQMNIHQKYVSMSSRSKKTFMHRKVRKI